MPRKEENREHWNSRIGIVLAVMGSAIGLGNFLRFPGLAARYGGGSFLIPYLIALLLLGLPIAWAEWSLGRMGGRGGFHSSPGIFHTLWKRRFSPYLGLIGLIIPAGIFMYYIFIEAWCLYYAWQYLNGALLLGKEPELYKSFFESFVGAGEDGLLWKNGLSSALYAVLLCYFINFAVLYRGLHKGIEVFSMYAIPVLFLCSFLILIRVLSLGTPNPDLPEQSVLNGLGFLWNPENQGDFWSSLWNAEMWLAAAGQIFFSLSVGFGVIINYASYLRKNDDVLLSGTTSASGNIFAEVALGAMITVPAAFVFLGPAGISNSSFALGFITLPNVFAYMPLGQLIGFLWFFLLFLAALTSSLSMLQPVLSFFKEGLALSKSKALALLAFVTFLGTAFISYFSKNSQALDMLDFWVGTALIYIMATIMVILFGWVIGAKKALQEARQGSLLRVPNFFAFVLKYISPLYLLTIFIFWIYEKLPYYWEQIQTEPVAVYTMVFIFSLLLFFAVLLIKAQRRWEKKN